MSKLGILIKNNLKLMLRNRVMIFSVIAGTVLVVAALSSAFHTLLDQAEGAGEFQLGYQIQKDSSFLMYEEMLLASLKKEGISCRKYHGEAPEEIVKNGQAEVFIDFRGDDYHIYGSRKKEAQVRSIQFALFLVTESMKAAQSGSAPCDFYVGELPALVTVGAQDYYSMIEIIYFLSICAIFVCILLQAERGTHIPCRFRVSGAGNAVLYFGRLIPCVLLVWVTQIAVTGGLVTVLFDVHWGKPWVVFPLLALEAAAFASFGMVFLLLFRNMAVAIGLQFMILWFCGFAGGTYETYMYSSVPDFIKELSPLYYLNRTIVEYSAMGESSFLLPCICYMAAILLVCVPLGILLSGRRKEIRI